MLAGHLSLPPIVLTPSEHGLEDFTTCDHFRVDTKRLFIFIESAETRPVLTLDELFDPLLFPGAALQER